LQLLDDLAGSADLHDYHHFHAARADLLRRAGRFEEAADAYEQALSLAQNVVEQQFLARRLAEIRPSNTH
jgi:RNA polymerase sigma-70 factor (ECF subfamily)